MDVKCQEESKMIRYGGKAFGDKKQGILSVLSFLGGEVSSFSVKKFSDSPEQLIFYRYKEGDGISVNNFPSKISLSETGSIILPWMESVSQENMGEEYCFDGSFSVVGWSVMYDAIQVVIQVEKIYYGK